MQEAFQLIANLHRPYASRRAGVYEVAHLQFEELRYVNNDGIKGEKEVFGVAVLHRLSVLLQLKFYGAPVALPDGQKITDHCRAVEALGNFPGVAFIFQALLHIAGGKVDAQTNFRVVISGKLRLYVTAVFADFQHHFYFMVQVFGEFRVVKGLVVHQQRRRRLHEYHRAARHRVIELFGVFGIVAADADDLHNGGLKLHIGQPCHFLYGTDGLLCFLADFSRRRLDLVLDLLLIGLQGFLTGFKISAQPHKGIGYGIF